MFLQNMREKTQSWVAYVIVALLILSFALWGISSYFSSGPERGPAATVGGEEIPYTNFVSAYHRFLQDAQAQGGAYTPEQEQYAKRLVLKSLVERVAILQYINKVGFAVDQQQIDAALMAVPLFSEQGEFSPALFKRFLLANGLSAQQFIADFSTKMMMAQWDEGIRITGFSTPLELANIVSLLKQKRTIVYGVIKANTKGLPSVTTAEAEDYYQDHQQDYLTPERVKIAYIKLSLSDVIKSLHPTEKDLITYYAQNSAHYDVPERWQVNMITQHSPTSATQAELAQQQTVWLEANNLSAEVKNALLQTAIKATTPAFKTSENTYIVYQLLKHQSAENKQYYQVKNKVQTAYLEEQANKKWAQMLEEMANLSYEHPDSLDPLAEKFNQKIELSNFFSHDYDGKTGIESNAEVITAAFSDDVLSGGNNSDVIKLDNGKTALVLRAVNSVAAHEQAFSEVQAAIKETLLNQQAVQRAKESAERVQHALESGEPIEKIQKTNGIILSQVVIGRFGQGASNSVPSEVLQQAFMLPLHYSGVQKIKDSRFSVLQVLSIAPGKMSSMTLKERAMYQNVIVNEWAQAELFAYVAAIMNDTKVKMNRQDVDANA
ncbi:MAG: SurA N-terminal domain-containing protein [Pseudomonadota bacterium]